jgi:N-methylhydantoinase A
MDNSSISNQLRYRIGIDTGGTFTDVVLIDDQEQAINITKVPSTPSNPARAVINGIDKMVDLIDIDSCDIDFLVHGTTVATNALLEYKGVKTALLVTEGFKDVLSIARQTRPKLYDWFVRRPEPLIDRSLRFEVTERMTHTGQVLKAIDQQQVENIARKLISLNITSIAVCLLHSYANPEHEQEIEQIFASIFPKAKVCLSSDVLRESREYERMSTTAINAYVMPIIEKYLGHIKRRLHEKEIGVELNVMQSNGGIMAAETAARKSINTILSGPAGGVIGCQAIALQAGIKNCITVDMGGTSFDVSLIYGGKLAYKTESVIVGHPVNAPMLDIHTIGAGGGSIAWIDSGGALRVGPQSAGADPGPVCYSLGGSEPTVTDANLVLGRLNADYYLGGEFKVDVEAAKQAIQHKIAQPLALPLESAAEGIIRVVNASMVRGIRTVSVEKGYDPREFSIMSFGGAGSLHAIDLARELDIPEVIVPPYPGVASALGLLTADYRYDYSLTFHSHTDRIDLSDLNQAFTRLEGEAQSQLDKEKVSDLELLFIRTVDMCYRGQAYQLNVPLPAGNLSHSEMEEASQKFHAQHKKLYGYARPDQPTEFIYLRLAAMAMMPKPVIPTLQPGTEGVKPGFKGYRQIFLDGEFSDTPVYAREKLLPCEVVQGPAVVEQFDTTVLIGPGDKWHLDEHQNLLITLGKLESGS